MVNLSPLIRRRPFHAQYLSSLDSLPSLTQTAFQSDSVHCLDFVRIILLRVDSTVQLLDSRVVSLIGGDDTRTSLTQPKWLRRRRESRLQQRRLLYVYYCLCHVFFFLAFVDGACDGPVDDELEDGEMVEVAEDDDDEEGKSVA